ncbi:methionine aminopeptidase 2 [mine drainage metagenome]|uniref:Methionine aminopeptidase 2 n=1 Tax=mine drainage metagenome TaxID=410659 RepID=A0A1J5ST96_9ZZZZ
MTIESPSDVEALQRIGRIVSVVLHKMLDAIEPGMTTRELDVIGAEMLSGFGARSAPQLAYNFPGATCISINEEAAHGVPGDRIIKAGDLVNVDVSAELDGYFADTGGTAIVPPGSPIKTRLCHATRIALSEAIKVARAGQSLNQIGKVIERVATTHQFRIIENLGGHGVGRAIHEEPEHILGYYDARDQRILKEGMVIAIEPFLSTKSRIVSETDDGWTLAGKPGNLSAQYEHTIIVTRSEPIILTIH